MKKILLLSSYLLITGYSSFSQNVGIGTANNKKENKGAHPETLEAGFIAQEVEQVLSELGYTRSGMITKNDSGYYGMRYNDILAPMVKAIQELHQQMNEQKKDIAELKMKNEILVKRFEKLVLKD